jgi:hypothetical protein
MGLNPVTGRTTALYSDVVASRPPSLREETTALISTRSSEDADSQRAPDRSQNEISVVISMNSSHEIINGLTSSEARFLLPNELEGDERTTMNHRRRVRSLGSMERTRNSSKERVHNVQALTEKSEQVFRPEAATKSLTVVNEQERMSWLRLRENIAIRAISWRHSPSYEQNMKGPPNKKEMCIDTRREWGQENIPQESRNVAATLNLTSLNQWNENLKAQAADKNISSEIKREKTHLSSHWHPSVHQPVEPAGTHSTAQVAKDDGYLSMALQNVSHCQFTPWRKYLSSSPPDFGSSENNDSKSDVSNRELDSDEARQFTNGWTRRLECCDNNLKHGQSSRELSRSSRSFKPVTEMVSPIEYDDKVDTSARTYIRESVAYLRLGYGKVQKVSYHYLSEKLLVYFYMQIVAIYEEEWTLRESLIELFKFNYYFPVYYGIQLRQTLALACVSQNDRLGDVYEHTRSAKLQRFNIHVTPDRDKVLTWWKRSRPLIQKNLWQLETNLGPEVSSWKQHTAQADIMEISNGIAERRDGNSGSSTLHRQATGMESASDNLGDG